jgi:putative redox protein
MTDPNLRHARLEWIGDLRFAGGLPGGPVITLDGKNAAGPSPMITLLLAIAACSGADVADILKKKRAILTRFEIDITGRRREEYPRRYEELKLIFRLAGQELTEEKARRAVELSVTKYCSVLATLNPDIPVSTEIVIEDHA